jgi:hypothetical protein
VRVRLANRAIADVEMVIHQHDERIVEEVFPEISGSAALREVDCSACRRFPISARRGSTHLP